MVANDPSAVLNSVICGVIVIVLMFYRRGDATHRPLISLLAYVMVLVYASVPYLPRISLDQRKAETLIARAEKLPRGGCPTVSVSLSLLLTFRAVKTPFRRAGGRLWQSW